MVDFGIRVSNASNFVQIDSVYRNYSFVKAGIAYSDWTKDNPIVATFPTQTALPIVTFRPPRRHYVSMNGVTATQAWFLASKNASMLVHYQVFKQGIITPATWGININNASGNTVFSSEDTHFIIDSAKTITNATIRSNRILPLAGNDVALKGINNYVTYSPPGVRERYNLPVTGGGWLYERALGWPNLVNHVNNETNATNIRIGRHTTRYDADFYGATSNTGNATVALVETRTTIPGMYQKWGCIRRFLPRNGHFLTSITKVPDTAIVLMGTGIEAKIWRAIENGKNYVDWGISEAQDFSSTAIWPVTINGIDGVTATLCLAVEAKTFAKGRILRSTDAGQNWTEVAVAPVSGQRFMSVKGLTDSIAVAGRTGVSVLGVKLYRSTDYGQNWVIQKSFVATLGEGVPDNIVKVSDSIALMTGGTFIWRSTDAGQNWSKVLNVGNATPVQLGMTSLAHVSGSTYIAGSSTPPHIWRSVDDGQNWVKIHNFAATSNVHPQTSVTALISTEGTTCIAGTSPGGQLWRSDDKGLTWPILLDELVYHTPGGNYIYDLVLCATNQVLAPTGGSGMLWRTFDYTT